MPQLDQFAEQDLASLPESLRSAIAQAPIPDLDSGPQVAELASLLAGDQSTGWAQVSPNAHSLGLSGLWLLAGDLDRSHTISQSIGSAEGSFWHGIMHRREGDFSNSKYWFRRVGDHPVLDQLAQLAGDTYRDPFDFVDACSRAVKRQDESHQRCVRAQWLEWQALMAYCVE